MKRFLVVTVLAVDKFHGDLPWRLSVIFLVSLTRKLQFDRLAARFVKVQLLHT